MSSKRNGFLLLVTATVIQATLTFGYYDETLQIVSLAVTLFMALCAWVMLSQPNEKSLSEYP